MTNKVISFFFFERGLSVRFSIFWPFPDSCLKGYWAGMNKADSQGRFIGHLDIWGDEFA